MFNSTFTGRALAGWLHNCFVAALICAGASLFAGEPIIVGKEKPKTDAVKESKFGKELFRPFDKSFQQSPMEGLMLPLPSIPNAAPFDPKRDRKRKLQERERKNWMSVLPGELQEEDEAKNFLGVREYDLESEEDDDNLMFRDLQKDKGSNGKSQNGGKHASKGNENIQQQHEDAEEMQRELDARRASRNASLKAEGELGAHTASDLNFKGLFGSPADSRETRDLSLRDALGGAQQPSRSQQALRDEFKAFLHGQAGPSGASDPINSWRSDVTRQPLNPAIARTPDRPNAAFNAPAGFAPNPQANSFAPSPGFDGAYSRVGAGVPGLGISVPTPSAGRPFQPPSGTEGNRGFGMNKLGGHR